METKFTYSKTNKVSLQTKGYSTEEAASRLPHTSLISMETKFTYFKQTKFLSKLVWRETLQTHHIYLYWAWILKI